MNTSLSVLTGGTVTFDPTQALAQSTNVPWQLPIYDSLLHRDATTGAFEPGLAERATIVDARTLTLVLRPSVTFSDGTPFDAAAVKDGLLRNKDAPQHGQFDGSLEQIAAIDVTGSLDLTVHFASPVAGQFYDQLCLPSTYIVSPTAAQRLGEGLGNAPVGAGPFKLGRYVSNQSITLVKNPAYWDAKAVHLSGIEFVNVASSPQEVNGLEAGTLDLTSLSDFGSPQILHGRYTVVQVRTSHYPVWSDICKSTSPLNDVRVRQALNYAIDRNEIVRTVLHGIGTPEWSLFPAGTPYYDPSLANTYAYSPNKARNLLAAAGYPNGFRTSMIVFPGSTVAAVDQVLQQEWSAVGVKLALVPSQNATADLYVRHVAPLAIVPGAGAGTFGPISGFVPGTISDLCGFDDPGLTAIYNATKGVDPTSSHAVALIRQAQRVIYQQALGIFVATTPALFAYNHKVSNLVLNPYYGIAPVPDYWAGVTVVS